MFKFIYYYPCVNGDEDRMEGESGQVRLLKSGGGRRFECSRSSVGRALGC